MLEVAIVGAGVAGITCGRELQAAGWQGIGLFEKSRGMGGRLTTRRLFDTRFDRGTCYLSPKGEEFRSLIDRLADEGIVSVWTDTTHTLTAGGDIIVDGSPSPRYIAPNGMNQIAKYLGQDLNVTFGQRAIALQPLAAGWKLILAGDEPREILARRVVIAIPAPQAVELLSSIAPILPPDFMDDLQSIEYTGSIAVAAGYTVDRLAQWQATYPQVVAVSCPADPDIAWLGLDSSKRSQPAPPVFVIQSSADFAARYPEPSDKERAGAALLESASRRFLPWFDRPEWQQPHLWRYAFPKNPRTDSFISVDSSHPLFCTGDWCHGYRVEDAFLAGKALAAEMIDTKSYHL